MIIPFTIKTVRTNIHNKTVNLLLVRSDTRRNKKTVVTRIFFVIQIHFTANKLIKLRLKKLN